MTSFQPHDDFSRSDEPYRPLPTAARTESRQNNSRMYEERFSFRESYDRKSPSPRRYTPPHDRFRTSSPRVTNGRTDHANIREWDTRRDRENTINYDDEPRGRSSSTHSGPQGGYRERDREGFRSPGYDNRSRSRSPRRDRSPYYGGPPSREVMMDGLPVDLVEEDISKELKQFHNVDELEDVRVIRDRQTKTSRGFGFLRFPTVEKAKAFLEHNYPKIYLYGKGSPESDDQAAKVRIAFSRERDSRGRAEKTEGEWTCKICTFVNFVGRKVCFKCQTPQIDMASFGNAAPAKPSEFLNSGDSDASPDGAPSQFLLLRGLEPTVTEDLLAKGVAKLYKPSGGVAQAATVASKKGNAKVASTTGDANLGAKDGTIRRVLLVRDRRSNESWRYGFAEFASVEDAQAAVNRFNSFEKFTISSKPVSICYIHAGVFVPVLNSKGGNERFTFSPLGNAAMKLSYWDQDAYVSEMTVSAAPDENNVKFGDRAKTAADIAATAAEKEGLVAPGKEAEMRAKKRKAELKAEPKPKKTAPAHLQFWSNRHAELYGAKSGSADGDAGAEETKDKALKSTFTERSGDDYVPSFADPNKKCCYLCSRQFKTDVEIKKHERISQLHRENLQNDTLKTKAIAKMTALGIWQPPPEQDTPDYRDRARERRAAFGATKKISLPMKKSTPTSQQPAATEEPADDDEPIAPSKGASLLGKMGWAAGEGLGAQGKGMTAPITTEMYVQGVGLGAQGGRVGDAMEEAARNTKDDYSGFLERTKDKAKERFDRMG